MSTDVGRIQSAFELLLSTKRKALVPYILAEDPPGQTVNIMHRLVQSGADIIELGFPFSDPVADGPVIAQAHQRAVLHGVTLYDVLDIVSQFRKKDHDTPIVLMGYTNPVEIMGYQRFIELASQAGVDGVLIVDLPLEEASDFIALVRKYNIDMINLITPTTSEERISKICALASGYLYYISLKGVTGSSALNTADVEMAVQRIRRFADVPVCVGFGISDEQTAAKIGLVADGVVIGSVLVAELANYERSGQSSIERAAGIISSMRSAMDQ